MNDFQQPEIAEPIDFDWDEGNQSKSLIKHRISKNEAEQTFFNDKMVQPDQRHSKVEQRFGLYGITNTGKVLFIAFTIRKGRVRIISARPANKEERILYEEAF